MKSPAVKSVQKGLVSMKDSLVESWAISDDDDEEYGGAEGYGDGEYSDTPTGENGCVLSYWHP